MWTGPPHWDWAPATAASTPRARARPPAITFQRDRVIPLLSEGFAPGPTGAGDGPPPRGRDTSIPRFPCQRRFPPWGRGRPGRTTHTPRGVRVLRRRPPTGPARAAGTAVVPREA